MSSSLVSMHPASSSWRRRVERDSTRILLASIRQATEPLVHSPPHFHARIECQHTDVAALHGYAEEPRHPRIRICHAEPRPFGHTGSKAVCAAMRASRRSSASQRPVRSPPARSCRAGAGTARVAVARPAPPTPRWAPCQSTGPPSRPRCLAPDSSCADSTSNCLRCVTAVSCINSSMLACAPPSNSNIGSSAWPLPASIRLICARSLRWTNFKAVFALRSFMAVSSSKNSGWQARFCRTHLETAVSISNYAWDITSRRATMVKGEIDMRRTFSAQQGEILRRVTNFGLSAVCVRVAHQLSDLPVGFSLNGLHRSIVYTQRLGYRYAIESSLCKRRGILSVAA